MKKLKRKLGLIVASTERIPIIRKVLITINCLIFHFDEREHMVNKWSKSDKTYYVIRPQSENVGLLASYFFVLRKTKEAIEKGYIPIVDFETNKCQYSVDTVINGTSNAWEYYFEQPSRCGINVLSDDSRIIYSGWKFFEDEKPLVLDESIIGDQYLKKLSIEKLPINASARTIFHKKYCELLENKRTLGVFVRGTDYVALKPKGHNIQPSIDMVIDKVNEYLNKYEIDQVFVVTEDYNYFLSIKEAISCPVVTSDNTFVKCYNQKDYVSESFSIDGYKRGMDYLIRLLLLTKCQYIISSYAAGSIYSKLIREETPIAEYWFELGKY